ncbi:MAG: GTPase Era [Candidatus Dasytiphilus stammeri]
MIDHNNTIENQQLHCGYIPIVGKSNVGKSTLLNNLIGQKISIVCRKAHTTRQCIVGIHTKGNYQTIYIDTPGWNNIKQKTLLNRFMNRNIINYIKNHVALVIFVTSGTNWTSNDNQILNMLCKNESPVLLVINKIDLIKNKTVLLPYIHLISQKMNFIDILPISASTGYNINNLLKIITKFLPKSNHLFPKKMITNQSITFMLSEIIREKLMHFLNHEIPYSVAVTIDQVTFNNKSGIYDIYGYILVERKGQKKIIIGYKNNKINNILKEASYEIELMMNTPVSINLGIKIKNQWFNDQIILKTLGY